MGSTLCKEENMRSLRLFTNRDRNPNTRRRFRATVSDIIRQVSSLQTTFWTTMSVCTWDLEKLSWIHQLNASWSFSSLAKIKRVLNRQQWFFSTLSCQTKPRSQKRLTRTSSTVWWRLPDPFISHNEPKVSYSLSVLICTISCPTRTRWGKACPGSWLWSK